MAMSLAGLASLYVCSDNLHAAQFLRCRGNKEMPALGKALAYVDEHFEDIRRQGSWFYYTLYGIERIALQNAASIAGLLLTTDALVSEIPEKKKKTSAGGGMGEDMY